MEILSYIALVVIALMAIDITHSLRSVASSLRDMAEAARISNYKHRNSG